MLAAQQPPVAGFPWQGVLTSGLTIAGVIVALFVVHRFLGRLEREGSGFRNQLIMLGLTLIGLVVVILVLPIGDRRQELLGLLGILASATIALSSTTFLGNAMAGLMMRAVRNFRMGDFIRCGEHFGRVSERGLFHTEIQTEDRELTTLPNLFLVTHPVTTIRASGTIVSATVSLGYDVPRARVQELLLEGATRAGLTEPFAQIKELGDFSVTYRIAGLLGEVKRLITAQSQLRGCVMDALHEGGVEIVSPSFMNQRVFDTSRQFVPERQPAPQAAAPSGAPEDLVFDKAEEAESLEALTNSRDKLLEQIESLKQAIGEQADEAEKTRMRTQLAGLESQRDSLNAVIEKREGEARRRIEIRRPR